MKDLLNKMNTGITETILNKLINEHLDRFEGESLELLDKSIESVNGFTFASIEYLRTDTKIFDLLYFRIVTFDGNIVYKSSNVLCYTKETYKPYSLEDLKKAFKNYLSCVNTQLSEI